MRFLLFLNCFVLALAMDVGWTSSPSAAGAEESPVRPYTDPSQLDVPWPKHSHYKQPWRGYLETRSAYDFLRGIGVNYHVPGNDALAVRVLAEAGFKTFRIEIGFGSVRWDQKGFTNEKHVKDILSLCKQHGIRPTMLLNAHQGAPCPLQFFNRRLAADAPKGSRTVKLTDTQGLVLGRSGINGLSDYWAAEGLITAIDPATSECKLSKPLPKTLKAGEIGMATLGCLPLHPVGTQEFDDTAAAWVRYAMMICRLVRDASIEDFDVEIWNELTFGTRFLDINNYYDPPKTPRGPDFLNRGGTCWELARRTVEAVKKDFPRVRCIWGFSNTTFYHCPIAKLPPGTDGQSYHPYGTGTRSLPQQEYHKDRPEFNLEGFTPTIDIRLPEGWAHTFIQTECLVRHLNPAARLKIRPEGVGRFYHYITEHGVVPGECGVRDEAGGWRLKTLCLTRSICLWLNKGVDVMHYFVAYDREPLGMGLLPADFPKLPADTTFDKAATPPLKALRNLTRALGDSMPLETTRPLNIEVTALGEQKKVFEGHAKHPPLWHRDVLAVLPFQITPKKFAVVVYVITYDATRPMAEERYRLAIKGVKGGASVALYDPLEDKRIAIGAVRGGGDGVEVDVPVRDYPRVLLMEE
jgi:hypothetical protein